MTLPMEEPPLERLSWRPCQEPERHGFAVPKRPLLSWELYRPQVQASFLKLLGIWATDIALWSKNLPDTVRPFGFV